MNSPIPMSDEVRSYIELIDSKFDEAVKEGYSRMSIEWGTWSREMNVEILEKIKQEHPDSLRLKYIFSYWIATSRLLEVVTGHHPVLTKSRVKIMENERNDLREIIFSPDPIEVVK